MIMPCSIRSLVYILRLCLVRLKIKNKIEQVYGKTIPNEELAYIAVHIQSLTRSIRLTNLEVL